MSLRVFCSSRALLLPICPSLKYLRLRCLSKVSSTDHASAALNSGDHKAMYQYKSNWDLLRSLLILKICSVNFFVDNSLTLMKTGQKVFGDRLFPLILRPTFYRQFVGGDSEAELLKTSETLAKSNLRLMVCPVQEEDVGESNESESKYDANKEYIIHTAHIMAKTGSQSPNLQLKVTAFMPADLVTKLSGFLIEQTLSMEAVVEQMLKNESLNFNQLTGEENEQLRRGLKRIKELIQSAKDKGLKILVDAEYTYMNPGISAVALTMMVVFNKDAPIVGNTYQCYLKDALNTIQTEKSIVDRHQAHFGAKIVRGAYLEKERKLAKLGEYPDPVNESYEATGMMYNAVIDFLTDEASKDRDIYIVVATHNDSGAYHAVERIKEKNLANGKFVFGQIYGMGEQLSMPLANAGLVVYKSVPYGPISEVLPYLSRRAAENRSIMAGARRERELLTSELKRRAKAVIKL